LKAAVIRSTGGPDVLRLEDMEPPDVGEGEVLIRVKAAALNPVDWKVRRGVVERELPLVLGEDVSGVVEASGSDGFAAGDEVFGVASTGGYAEYAVARASAIALKPRRLSFEQAAALPVSGTTAWQALFSCARVERRQSVLVVGAGGGVGHLAVQFARHAGARVMGTGSDRSRDFVLRLGADEFIDYTRGDIADFVRDVAVALDTVGGATTAALLPVVREGGTLVTMAYPAEPPPQCHRIWVRPLAMKPCSELLARIGELVASGTVRVELAQTLPLTDVRRAHELSESGHTRGKIVLTLEP
jgi:NADPH:quinone reductase-like Zn-dependent oxidoreductase